MKDLDKFMGCMYGLAIDSSLTSSNANQDRPLFLPEYVQKSIAVANAIVGSANPSDFDEVIRRLTEELAAAGAEKNSQTVPKSCLLAAMTAPIGLFYELYSQSEIVARRTGMSLYAHPTAIASGMASACLTWFAQKGFADPCILIRKAREIIVDADKFCKARNKIRQVQDALALEPEEAGKILGCGKKAEEAVAIALYSFLRSPKDYAQTVATASAMDQTFYTASCIAGAISGAYNGIKAIPENLAEKVSAPVGQAAKSLYEKSCKCYAEPCRELKRIIDSIGENVKSVTVENENGPVYAPDLTKLGGRKALKIEDGLKQIETDEQNSIFLRGKRTIFSVDDIIANAQKKIEAIEAKIKEAPDAQREFHIRQMLLYKTLKQCLL